MKDAILCYKMVSSMQQKILFQHDPALLHNQNSSILHGLLVIVFDTVVNTYILKPSL